MTNSILFFPYTILLRNRSCFLWKCIIGLPQQWIAGIKRPQTIVCGKAENMKKHLYKAFKARHSSSRMAISMASGVSLSIQNGVAANPFHTEAGLAVDRLRPRIKREDLQFEPVQPEHLERKVADHPDHPEAEALPAVALMEKADAEIGTAQPEVRSH